MAIYTIAARSAGGTIADALLRLGHRKVAYLSPYQGLWWSEQRWHGLRAGFLKAGLEGAAIPFGLRFGRKYNRVLQAGGFDRRLAGRGSAVFAGILRERLGKSASAEGPAARMRDEVFPGLYATLEFDLLDRWFEEEIQAAMLSAFRQALADREITAWVGANDATALAAARFLRSQGTRVPEDISLAGFDNTSASFAEGLTSYNFGIPDFPRQLLRFILHPGQDTLPKVRTEEVAGVLLTRGSTGPARNR